MGIVSSGVGSGLDITGLINQLVAAEGQPVSARLDRKEATAQAKISALGTLKGAFSDFQTTLQDLQNSSSLDLRNVTSSDKDVFTVTASNGAQPGKYSVEVSQLAEAHKIKSASYTDTTTSIGSGTLTFQFGTYDSGPNTFTLNSEKSAQVVTIPSTDTSLSGIRDAVNEADIGVTASIINDGSANYLVFSSQDMGTANSLRVLTDDADLNDVDNAGLSELAYDPTKTAGTGKNLTETTVAKDALLKVDGIDITSSTNSITSVIEGLTISLVKADAGVSKTLDVSLNNAALKNQIKGFVASYNTVVDAVASLASYDPDTKVAGLLLGDPTIRAMSTKTRQILNETVEGLSGSYNALAAIGITTDSSDHLTIDDSDFDDAIENDFSGVGRIFVPGALSTDSLIKYDSSTTGTIAGDYFINVSQLATQGDIVASTAANLTITGGSNDTIVFTVDGIAASITLNAGTYTAVSLAAEVQSKLNGKSELSTEGISVSVTESSGVLTVSSKRYGSASKVETSGGNGLTDLLGGSPTSTDGLDAAGTINGAAAVGSGRFLTGIGDVAGLKLEVLGGSTGDRGSIAFSQGLAMKIDGMLEGFLEAEGVIAERTESLNNRIDEIIDQRGALIRRMDSLERRLTKQFTALDLLLSQLQTSSAFLETQLKNLPGVKKPNNN